MADKNAIVTTNSQGQGNVSLQCPKLIATNYTSWSIMMETVLRAYGIWDMIDPGTAVDEKRNCTTKALIFQTLPEEVLLQAAKHKSAKNVWESIKVRYLGAERVQQARLQTLRSEFELLKMKDSESVDEFAGKISGLEAKFKKLGSTLGDAAMVRKLLNAAPKKYLQIVASIEQYSDLNIMLFEEAVGRLTAYEERIKVQEESEAEDQGKLLLARDESAGKSRFCEGCSSDQNGRGRGRGYSKGRGGQFQPKEDRKEQGNYRDKKHIKCYNCQKYGHYAAECPDNESREEEANLTRGEEEHALL